MFQADISNYKKLINNILESKIYEKFKYAKRIGIQRARLNEKIN